ncbi:MAG: Na+-driven multidrug efflux pump [Paracoccaceae bacterium]|jgi:Na+-driven multidrug efflux pump
MILPLYMLLVALSTLVSAGFSSIYARTLGADDHDEAQRVFPARCNFRCWSA